MEMLLVLFQAALSNETSTEAPAGPKHAHENSFRWNVSDIDFTGFIGIFIPRPVYVKLLVARQAFKAGHQSKNI